MGRFRPPGASHSGEEVFMAIATALVLLVAGVIALSCFLFWIWMLIDCAMNEPSEGNDKIVWVVIMVFVHFIGALIYFFVRRPERIRLHGR
jgi:hypothetical protein